MYMYQIFLSQSSIDGHLDCFYVLAIVNSAAMNTEVHVYFWTMLFSGYMPSSGIAGLYGSFIPSFLKGISILFSIVAVSVYISHNYAGGFPYLHIFASIYCL